MSYAFIFFFAFAKRLIRAQPTAKRLELPAYKRLEPSPSIYKRLELPITSG
jgi:hypothetical protein